MERIAVLTSGGDAPGMNAAIRAVARIALHRGAGVFGVRRGFYGLMHGEIAEILTAQVADILHRGGTILRSARCPEFKTEEGVAMGVAELRRREIGSLVVIGGDGSLRGALALTRHGLKIAGVPASIDNDISGTDYAIGFDTAVNTVLDAVNKIRDTASSHARVYVIEVMGRSTGFIALAAGLAGGADIVLIPERGYDLDLVARQLRAGYDRGKSHGIVLVAEGLFGEPMAGFAGSSASAFRVAQAIRDKTDFETRLTILGHIQRGGTPSALDRLNATRSGAKAAELLLDGQSGKMVGFLGGRLNIIDLEEALRLKREVDEDLVALTEIMAVT